MASNNFLRGINRLTGTSRAVDAEHAGTVAVDGMFSSGSGTAQGGGGGMTEVVLAIANTFRLPPPPPTRSAFQLFMHMLAIAPSQLSN